MCMLDALFVMYAIGGATLGWAGMKAYKKYRSNKKNDADAKSNETPATVNQ